MDFLRQHGFFIACGLCAAAGIALGVTGIRRMPQVVDEMQKVEGLHRNLSGLESQPVNIQRIEAEERRIELVEKDRDRVFDQARKLYGWELLIPNVCVGGSRSGERCEPWLDDACPDGGRCEGVFPEGAPLKRVEFRRKYKKAMDELLASMKCGSTATPADVALMRDRFENEQALLREFEVGRLPNPPDLPSGPSETPAGVLTAAGIRANERARASVFAAQRIFCYIAGFEAERPPTSYSSLHFYPAMVETEFVEPPDAFDTWHAQINYWMQKGLVDAVAAVNQEAADELRDRGVHAWVGNLPIKDVVSVRVATRYVEQAAEPYSGSRPGGTDVVVPPASPHLVFTQSASNDWYEVVQSSMKLVMDQRSIPRLIQRLSEDSFHIVLRVAYVTVPPNRRKEGKIYGAGPVVNVVIDLETIMLGEVFRPWMPEEVCSFYNINCPPRQGE